MELLMVSMHGYAAYVWPSYIVAALVMLGMAAISIRALRKAQRTLAALQGQSPDET
jgi:heme exporter protein D